MHYISYLFLRSVLVFITSAPLGHVEGFASWLRCYVELDSDEVVMNHHIVPVEKSPRNVNLLIRTAKSGEGWSTTYEGQDTLEIYLEFPLEVGDMDIQWVIEVLPEGSAQFIGAGRMCQGARAFSTNEIPVVLNIKDPTQHMQLVAGYAAGHEAVVLTPTLVLQNIKESLSKEL